MARKCLNVGDVAAGLQQAREERGAEFVRAGPFYFCAFCDALDDLVEVGMFLAGDGGKYPA